MVARVAVCFALAIVTAVSDSPCDLSCSKVTKAVTCTAGCKGIDVGICKTTEYVLCKAGCAADFWNRQSCEDACEKKLVDPCVKQLVDNCDEKCIDTIVKPCQEGCERDGLKICDTVISKAAVTVAKKTVAAEVCGELCTEAAALADGAGAGPEDPLADAVAAAIEIGCNPGCVTAITKYALQPLGNTFANFVCKKIGFTGDASTIEV